MIWLRGLTVFFAVLGALVNAAYAKGAQDADASTVANDARLGGDLVRTRFVADLSEAVDFRAFILANPYRVIVDLPEVKFLMPSGVGAKGKGLVSAFRFGLFAQGKSRIVIDVVEPVLIDKAFVRAAENGQPARLVLDLVRTTKEKFEKQLQQQAVFSSTAPGSFKPSVEPLSPLGGQDGGRSGATPTKHKPVVVLDPGHGGVDPGAISIGGKYEKNIVFSFAQLLKSKLEATGKYRIVMTRDEDIFIPLEDRVKRARKEQADLLLSIHANAMDLKHPVFGKAAADVRGASVYTLSEEASDDLAKAIARKENTADIVAGAELAGATDDDLASILIDLMHRETKNLSVAFAQTLLTNLKTQVKLTPKPHRFANFRVLKAQDVPSVLLELGYLSHKGDERAMISKKWRSEAADKVVKAINVFFARRQVSMPR
ncbi:MAG: N-acetylmuramoyl-L-alanine amidase [Alphaproteobacteria bacterium]